MTTSAMGARTTSGMGTEPGTVEEPVLDSSRSIQSAHWAGASSHETATMAAVTAADLDERAPLAAHREPRRPSAGCHLGEQRERPHARSGEPGDDHRREQDGDVAAPQLREREHDERSEQERAGQPAQHQQQQHGPQAQERGPRQDPQRCEDLEERRRIEVRALLADRARARTGRPWAPPSRRGRPVPGPGRRARTARRSGSSPPRAATASRIPMAASARCQGTSRAGAPDAAAVDGSMSEASAQPGAGPRGVPSSSGCPEQARVARPVAVGVVHHVHVHGPGAERRVGQGGVGVAAVADGGHPTAHAVGDEVHRDVREGGRDDRCRWRPARPSAGRR